MSVDSAALATHTLAVWSRQTDPRAAGLLADARALPAGRKIERLEVQDLYFIEGQLDAASLQRLAERLLCDPLTHAFAVRSGPAVRVRNGPIVVEVARRPGVTDPVAEQIVRAAPLVGVTGLTRAATGRRYLIYGLLSVADLRALAHALLANPVIQRYTLGEIEPVFPHPAEGSGQVETIPLRALDEAGLLRLSADRRAALNLAEMQAVQAYFQQHGRDPSDVEFETIAQTWSEHCVHKTFRARITIEDSGEVIDGLLNTFIRSATAQIGAAWVKSAFVDNAGILEFDDEYDLSFKVETHNHPSAIEPFGGANTGLGGVIRDVLGVSARPIAATDVLCFGAPDAIPPAGALPPRLIRSGVVAGIQDYGNKIGLATVNGAVYYAPGYLANPLVFCGCVGLAPKNRHPRAPLAGDRLILLGGRTGRDGLRGATFSSMTMDAQTGSVAGASVQIGDPIIEQSLIEVLTRARDQGLYHAITDCGAGGLSSAVGEMAGDTGAEIELERVPLKYPGLTPWEIWLSEAQERMVLAAPAEAVPALLALCRSFDVELTDIGQITASGRLVARHLGQPVLDLSNGFLHTGRPRLELTARRPRRQPRRPIESDKQAGWGPLLLRLLAHPNIASKADIIRRYDHEVQGGTIIKPLVGAQADGPSDACVLKPAGTAGLRGLALSNGLNPLLGEQNAYDMALAVVDEAIRNAVAVGADPDRLALLDNFCWGDPQRPETLYTLVEAARGCRDAAVHHHAPFISGKDSLNNEYLGEDGQRHAIPPTLLISAIALVEDVSRAVSMDLKASGDRLYLLGEAQAGLQASHARLLRPGLPDDGGPAPLPEHAPGMYRALHRAMQAGLVRACHDLSEGGLAVAAAEMCLAGRLGLALTLPAGQPAAALFGEANARLLVEVRPEDAAAFEGQLAGYPLQCLGQVTAGEWLSISQRGAKLLEERVGDLARAWNQEAR